MRPNISGALRSGCFISAAFIMRKKSYPFPADFFCPPLKLPFHPSYKPPLLAGNSPLASARDFEATPVYLREKTPDFKRVSLRISNSCKAIQHNPKIPRKPRLHLSPLTPRSSLPSLKPLGPMKSEAVLPSIQNHRRAMIEVALKSMHSTIKLRSPRSNHRRLESFGAQRTGV